MKKIELDTPVDELSEQDLRATFSEVMDAHTENVDEAEKLSKQVAEYSERIEALEAEVEAAKAYFSEKAASVTSIDSETLSAKFSLEELRDLASKADAEETEPEQEFSEEPAEEADPEESPKFSEKADKAPVAPEDDGLSQYREEAKSRLSRIPGLVLEP